MKWVIVDHGGYDSVWVKEAHPRPNEKVNTVICRVVNATPSFVEPAYESRLEMLATAKEIVDAHNAKETP
jgi:hypothetical protein